jgi:HAD superfamily hydrolase (TIGR01450 family)
MIRLVIFDLDGTLIRGSEAIPGAVETVLDLRSRGILVRFLTNNSGSTRAGLASKLNGLGFEVSESEVFGTAPFAASVCLDRGFRNILLIGEIGLYKSFLEVGLTIPLRSEEVEDKKFDAVVAGICRSFAYNHINQALQAIKSGATFIATNRDRTYPIEGGREQPGAGAIIAAIEATTGITPEVLGKPNPAMILHILRETGIPATETLVVGDRIETDIEAGQTAECQTLLVLSGATTKAPKGTAFANSVSDLKAILN